VKHSERYGLEARPGVPGPEPRPQPAPGKTGKSRSSRARPARSTFCRWPCRWSCRRRQARKNDPRWPRRLSQGPEAGRGENAVAGKAAGRGGGGGGGGGGARLLGGLDLGRRALLRRRRARACAALREGGGAVLQPLGITIEGGAGQGWGGWEPQDGGKREGGGGAPRTGRWRRPATSPLRPCPCPAPGALGLL
jgi:hypothetical protein